MEKSISDIDWYAIVKCSIHSTKEEISKSVRKLALKYHPDKTDDPKAPEIFLQIQNAKAFLLDDAKRAEYDEALKKISKRKQYDAEKNQHMNATRKKMKQAFEDNLMKATSSKNDTTVHAHVEKTTINKDVIDRLRKENIERMHNMEKDINEENKQSPEEDISSAIKVKWRRGDESYSDETLFQIFKTFGDIGDISFVGTKGDSACITFLNPVHASNAVNLYLNSSKFRVTLYDVSTKKKNSIFSHTYAGNLPPSGTSPHINVFGGNNENSSELLRAMKRAVEREALLQKMQADEALNTSNPFDQKGFQNTLDRTTSERTVETKGDQVDVTPKSPLENEMAARKVVSNPALFAAKENDILARMMMMGASKMKAN